VHGIGALHGLVQELAPDGGWAILVEMAANAVVGIVVGAVVLLLVELSRRVRNSRQAGVADA